MSLQRCEARTLEAVLEEVRSRWGDEATIVEANRLRRGGVAGFFARETFEVVVDAAEAGEQAEAVGGPDHAADGPDDVAAGPAEALDFADRLLGLAEQVSDDEQADADPDAGVSTEHPDFAALLSSLQEHVEPASPPAADLVPEVDRAARPAPPPAAVPAPAPAATPAPVPVAAPRSTPVANSAPAPVLSAVVSPPTPSLSPDQQALVRVGLPEDLVRPARPGADPSRSLIGLLENVPRPAGLPRSRGAVVAVVGPRESALALARELAAELELDDDSILLASARYRGYAVPPERCIDTVELAAEERRSWRRRAHPTVVAVECTPGRSVEWGRRMLDALEPTMVWATVEATRKPEDLSHWSEQAGGFDALAVTGLDDTVSPASVLRCGIPVGRIDGRPATPALWAALLAERIAA